MQSETLQICGFGILWLLKQSFPRSRAWFPFAGCWKPGPPRGRFTIEGFMIAKKPALLVLHQDGLIFAPGVRKLILEGMESEAL